MKIHVLLVSNQVRGVSGTGGLGDVATALSKTLAQRDDVEIRLLMPGFEKIREQIPDCFDQVVLPGLEVPYGDGIVPMDVCRLSLPASAGAKPVTVYLLRAAGHFPTANDSAEQAVLLARGTLAFLQAYRHRFPVDLVHCNDWHAALLPVYLHTLHAVDPYLGGIATLYTTHNTGYGYQGGFDDAAAILKLAGLPKDLFRPGRTRSLEHGTQFNFAKGGFGFTDLISTVSPQYRQEILTPAFGGGLEGLFRERRDDLYGVLNGLDTEEWNLTCDHYLAPLDQAVRGTVLATDPADATRRYILQSDSPARLREMKKKLRSMLRAWMSKDGRTPFAGLRDDTILPAVVSRISDQKFPILMEVLEEILLIPGTQFLLLGDAAKHDPLGQAFAVKVRELQAKYPDNLLFFEGFDIRLSHLIYAAADVFLVPSGFEPCGLTQLIAMRNGTVPVVRHVGGLVDTVNEENGFPFLEPRDNEAHMVDVPAAARLLVERTRVAVAECRENPGRWHKRMAAGLSPDYSWVVPAGQYLRLYHEAIRRHLVRCLK